MNKENPQIVRYIVNTIHWAMNDIDKASAVYYKA